MLFADGWLDRDWTSSPIFVQCLSNVCPTSVQLQTLSSPCPTMSRLCPMSVEQVKTLSIGCQVSVQAKTIGQALDVKIQHLSRFCPIKYNDEMSHNRQTLDKLWTWTNLGQTLAFRSFTKTCNSVDILWTNL